MDMVVLGLERLDKTRDKPSMRGTAPENVIHVVEWPRFPLFEREP